MSNRYIFEDINSTIENNKKINIVRTAENGEEINFKKSTISNDIVLVKDEFYFPQKTTIENSANIESLCINIILDGELSYKDRVLDETISKTANTMFIKYFNNTHSIYEAKKDSSLRDIGVVIKGDFLKKNLLEKLYDIDKIQKDYEQDIPTVLKKAKTNVKTSLLAKEISDSPFHGDLNEIFLQSKVYEIIFNEFSDILDKDKNKNLKKEVKLTKEDIEALYKAKALISEEKRFLSISSLSKDVALNEFKLKYGFKKLFNTSPGNMMLDYRMVEAKKLLEGSEFNVSEIALLVGYKRVQSFTVAFKKKFGLLPKDVMKTRKYYY